MAEQEHEKTFDAAKSAVAEFMFGVLRQDIAQLRSDITRLADRQDAQFKLLLERQERLEARLMERQDRLEAKLVERQDEIYKSLDGKIHALYRIVIVGLIGTLGSILVRFLPLPH